MESIKFFKTLRTWAMTLLVGAFSINATAWDSSDAYNTVAMSYTANTTITQFIVLNDAQRASGAAINFVVDVKNGGGRPTMHPDGTLGAYASQTDKAWVTIYAYNSSGALIGSATSQEYVLQNWGSASNPGWSTGPGDNIWDFTQASVSYTSDTSQVAYIKIEMKGTDGAWWAGNYGAQWRTPTVTVGDSNNLVYNSEFGVASNGIQAQGWTSSTGSWSSCGVTSGSLTCVTQESGVTANMWGGGEDLSGGTTSGTAGGYSSVLTSDNAEAAAAGEDIANPGGGGSGGGGGTPTFIQLKFGRFQVADTQWNVNACLNTTTCQIYSKQPGVMYKIPWTQGQWQWQPGQYVQFSISGDPSFPYVAKVYNSDGTEAGVIGTGKIVNMGPDYFFFIGDDNNTGQLFSLTSGMSDTSGVSWTGTLNPTQEQVDAYAAGGSTSPLAAGETAGAPGLCCGGSAAPFNANAGFVGRLDQWNNNNITGDNAVNITQIGNYNAATVQQSGNRNYVELSVAGHNNTSTVTQSTTGPTQSNYIEATVLGNSNSTQLEQISTGQVKGIYATVTDDNNSVVVQQKDSGGHYAEINLSGGNKTVDLLQQGGGNHMARITLSGGATSITTTQSGGTQQHYSIDHNCAQASCAAITVTQGQ